MKQKSSSRPNNNVTRDEMVAAYDELSHLAKAHPKEAAEVNPKYGKKNLFERVTETYLRVRDRFHIETQVNRKTYLWLHLLGPFGIHHFYARHWIKGAIYLAISWSGVSTAMTFIDWMTAFPQKADENGLITV